MGGSPVGGPTAGMAMGAARGIKEPSPKERVADITKDILASQELKDFEAALKEHGISYIKFGDPPKEYKIPLNNKTRAEFAKALATILDKQSTNPAKNDKPDPDLAKDYARSFLSLQTDAIRGQDVYDPKEVQVHLTIQTPDYSPKSMDFSDD